MWILHSPAAPGSALAFLSQDGSPGTGRERDYRTSFANINILDRH